MTRPFTILLFFQVKPDRAEDFEALFETLQPQMSARPGCRQLRVCKRFFTFDGVEAGAPPRMLTRVVKCVKYYAYWEFEDIERSGEAQGWFFQSAAPRLGRLLIAPFDISSGYLV